MRRTFIPAVIAILLTLPAIAGAQEAADPPAPTGGPASTDTTVTEDPTTPTTTPPADGEGADPTPPGIGETAAAAGPETAVSVDDETEYRNAVTTLSADNTGPHTITLTQDIVLTGTTDPTYTGTQPLTIDGAGFLLDGGGNSRVLVYASAPTTPVTLQDITVQNGHVEGTGTQRGGAVFTTSSIVVRNATFTGNSAVSTDDSTSGGAVYARDDLGDPISVTIEDSEFSQNVADGQDSISVGGALTVGTVTTLTVTGSTFDTNTAKNKLGNATGGAISGNAETVDLSDSALVGNTVVTGGDGGGGAATLQVGTELQVLGSRVEGNSIEAGTRAAGGGLSLSTAGTAPLLVSDSSVSGNVAETDSNIAEGGGLRINSLPTTIRRSLIAGNRASSDGTASWGGGISLFSAATTGSQLVVDDSTMSGNRAHGTATVTEGGGIRAFNIGSGPILAARNTTISGNSAEAAAGEGGGIRAQGATLDHVTVASNSAAVGANLKDSSAGGGMSFAHTVLADPLGGGENCALGVPPSDGFNADDDGSCNLDQLTDLDDLDDALLGQVRDNGDLVAAAEAGGDGTVRPTMFPLNGSPLIDAVPLADCSSDNDLLQDQRGIPRPFGAGCDIGAIEAVFPAHTQTGVTPFYEATVRWVTSDVNTPQILSGFGDGSFGQTLPITRGQAARLYYNGAGAPDVSGLTFHGFSDGTVFFNDAITYAKANGIFDGFPDNTFRPNDPINRGNFIRSLYGFAGSQDVTALPDHPFTDVTLFYDDAVKWAKAQGLADGFPDDTFRQNNNINRGNASRTFYNTAQTPAAWADTMTAPPNMLFRNNLAP